MTDIDFPTLRPHIINDRDFRKGHEYDASSTERDEEKAAALIFLFYSVAYTHFGSWLLSAKYGETMLRDCSFSRNFIYEISPPQTDTYLGYNSMRDDLGRLFDKYGLPRPNAPDGAASPAWRHLALHLALHHGEIEVSAGPFRLETLLHNPLEEITKVPGYDSNGHDRKIDVVLYRFFLDAAETELAAKRRLHYSRPQENFYRRVKKLFRQHCTEDELIVLITDAALPPSLQRRVHFCLAMFKMDCLAAARKALNYGDDYLPTKTSVKTPEICRLVKAWQTRANKPRNVGEVIRLAKSMQHNLIYSSGKMDKVSDSFDPHILATLLLSSSWQLLDRASLNVSPKLVRNPAFDPV